MLFLRCWIRIVACAALLTIIAVAAHGTVIYEYTGNPFTQIFERDQPAGTYTTDMFVTIELTVGAPLAPNLSDVDLSDSLLSFRFNDGRRAITDTSFDVEVATLLVSTDSNGSISEWLADVRAPSQRKNIGLGEQLSFIGTYRSVAAPVADFGALLQCTVLLEGLCNAFNSDSAHNEFSPGIWTLIPEPSTAALVSLGLLGLAAGRRVVERA